MRQLTYYWVNVFTTEQDKGTPLPVFILDSPLSHNAMQKIATMMNQAETVFIERAQEALPFLHIFTPMQALPFAGHPIIGALIILELIRNHQSLAAIECKAGIVAVEMGEEKEAQRFEEIADLSAINHHTKDRSNIYWIKAPQAPTARKSSLTMALSAKMLGISPVDISSPPEWISTGSEQLLIELKDAAAIDRIALDITLFKQHATLYEGRTILYLWALNPDHKNVYARYLYLKNGALEEDSGTGSACANLGGYQVLKGRRDFSWKITQAHLIQKEAILHLKVASDESIWIGGQNRYMGQGELLWQD